VKLYEAACAAYAPACFNAGSAYLAGEGVPRDPARAGVLYAKACDGGEPRGCFNLGVLHRRGEGVPKNAARAAAMFKKACAGGVANACRER